MPGHRHFTIALFAAAGLLACSQPEATPAAAVSATSAAATAHSRGSVTADDQTSAPVGTDTAGANQAAMPAAAAAEASDPQSRNPATTDRGLLGAQIDSTFSDARAAMREGNLSLNSGPDIQIGGTPVHGRTADLPQAEITPRGDLLIEGQTVAITPAQRQRLLDYRERVLAIADAGIDVGARGAGIAGTAVLGIPALIFGGDQGREAYEAQMQAEGERIQAATRRLCAQMPPLYASQQRLAASLPAFRPYATMAQIDADKCIKDTRIGSVDSKRGIGTK